MHIRKSIKQKGPIAKLPEGRVRITHRGEYLESIWVAIDKKNEVMYLLNDALVFYPLPSWGMELPLQKEINLHKYRGGNFKNTDITVCEEAYEALKEFINENDEFDCEAYLKKFA